jgi:CRP/FNR family transcriptional regulator, cyclic AMP receptor protein
MIQLHEHPEVASVAQRGVCAAGEVVFEVGDPIGLVHIVLSGAVFVRSITLDGETAVVDVRGRGDLLDDTALLDDASQLHYDGANALTAVEFLRLPLSSLDDLRDSSAAIGAALVAQLTEQVRRLSSGLVDLHARPAKARAAQRLIVIAETLARSDMGQAPLTATQQDLADYVGTTRSTLNACLQEFERASALVSTRGRLTITDPQALARFV